MLCAIFLAMVVAASAVQDLAPNVGGDQVPKPTQQAPAEKPAVDPGATRADPGAPGPKIDIGKAIAEVVARMLATPRFEEYVEVRDRYQEALNAHLRAADLSCGSTSSGPPPSDEMNRFREARIPPHADLLAGAKWLFAKLKRRSARKGGHYYLYSVSATTASGRFVFVVRDGPISEDSRSSVPGISWTLVGRYADRGKASDAVTRLQKGGVPDDSGSSQVLWATTDCGQ